MSESSHQESEQGKVISRGPLKWAVDKLTVLISRIHFRGSADYWDWRYRVRGSSGRGSYGVEAKFKADFINTFITENTIDSVIDFGCGDGAQLALLKLPRYLGIDASDRAIAECRARFESDNSKQFSPQSQYAGQRADLAMSLDVVYHLVEDEVFEMYVDQLFLAADRFVIIYSTDHEGSWPSTSVHVRHRRVSDYCATRHSGFEAVQGIDAGFGVGSTRRRFMIFIKK